MKVSTVILLGAFAAFVFAPNTDGSRLWDDIRAVGLDLGAGFTIALPMD